MELFVIKFLILTVLPIYMLDFCKCLGAILLGSTTIFSEVHHTSDVLLFLKLSTALLFEVSTVLITS